MRKFALPLVVLNLMFLAGVAYFFFSYVGWYIVYWVDCRYQRQIDEISPLIMKFLRTYL